MDGLGLEWERLVSSLKYYGHDWWEEYGDSRVSHLPLLNSGPWHVVSITILYLYFVKSLGPKLMRDKEPFQLRGVMIFHNAFLVLLNGIGFSVAMWGTSLGAVTLECRPFDPSSSDVTEQILLYLGYTYYVSKFIDFLDTVYFVLRKKDSHVSGLHVFHHTMMPFWCYIFFKFSTYTNNGFIPLVNAFIHTIMYSYYALAALGPQMAPFLWWKRYITQLQLIQFVLCTIHSLYMLGLAMTGHCHCSKLLIVFQVLHSILFLVLFGNFYRRTYQREQAALSKARASALRGQAKGQAKGQVKGQVGPVHGLPLKGKGKAGALPVNARVKNSLKADKSNGKSL